MLPSQPTSSPSVPTASPTTLLLPSGENIAGSNTPSAPFLMSAVTFPVTVSDVADDSEVELEPTSVSYQDETAQLTQLLNMLLPPPPVVPPQVQVQEASATGSLLLAATSMRPTEPLNNRASISLPAGTSMADVLLQTLPECKPDVLPVSSHIAYNQADSSAKIADLSLSLNVTDGQQLQGDKLRQVLGERLQLQLDQRVQHATIRLDPPDLGKIDISLQMDANKLNVQIHAGQPEVARALQQVSNELRQTLTEQNSLQVQVNISSQQQGQSQTAHRQPLPEQSAGEISQPDNSDTDPSARSRQPDRTDSSILTTV